MKKRILIAIVAALGVVMAVDACTSAIVSGKLTANGRPLMWKNRDTNDLNNSGFSPGTMPSMTTLALEMRRGMKS